MKAIEKEIEFNFTGCWVISKYDLIPKAQGVKSVDFVVEEVDRMILVEAKDPSKSTDDATGQPLRRANRPTAQADINSYLASIISDLIKKCEDSARDLHPGPRGTKVEGFVYAVLVELEKLDGLERKMFERWRTQIHTALKAKFATNPAPVEYKNCFVCDLRGWKTTFPNYPVRRIV